MFIFRKIKMYLLLAAILGAIGFGAWKYYEHTQNQIRIFAENAARSELVASETQKDLEQVKIEFKRATQAFESAAKRVDVLEKKLAEHDIDYLAAKRPKDVEKIIDKASDNVLRCIEIASGSPLTEDEINATKRSKINNECPDLANPNYRP
jgi:predicted negative regulator of RcsB-dependent stress response